LGFFVTHVTNNRFEEELNLVAAPSAAIQYADQRSSDLIP
jgi:hypothetical protein